MITRILSLLIGGVLSAQVAWGQSLTLKQSAGAGTAPMFGAQTPGLQGPDESILWNLFHAGKVDALRQQILDLHKRFPNWQPSSDLQKALAGSSTGSKRRSARIGIARKKVSFCVDLERKWAQASDWLNGANHQAGLRQYRRLIAACEDQDLKQLSLSKAAEQLSDAEFDELRTFAERYIVPSRLDQIDYQRQKQRYIKQDAPDSIAHADAVRILSPGVFLYRDGRLAELIAWRFFDAGDSVQARYWFETAQTLGQPVSPGYLLTLEKLGLSERLLQAYANVPEPNAEFDSVAARSYKNLAWQQFHRQDFVQAEHSLQQAERLSPNDWDITETKAWLADRQQNHGTAAPLFESLYAHSPRPEYARAYLKHQQHVDPDVLDSKLIQYAGPMFDEYNKAEARELYYRKQFLAAEALSPGLSPNLHNIDSAYVDMGGYARNKSGEPGLSQLEIIKAPEITASFTLANVHQFKISIDRVDLDAGGNAGLCTNLLGGIDGEQALKNYSLQQYGTDAYAINLIDALNNPAAKQDLGQIISGLDNNNPLKRVGESVISLLGSNFSETARNSCLAYFQGNNGPTGQLSNGVEAEFLYRRDGWFSPYLRLGNTPSNGVIAPTITFNAGFVQQTEPGNWGVDIYSQPVRQSILSYTGVRAPYLEELTQLFPSLAGQLEWGRVLRSGIKANGYYRLNDWWSLSASADAAMLKGENVEDNTAVAIAAGIARNFQVSGFDYFSVGPSFIFEHYAKNLSYFLPGHGGYFSPNQYYNLGFGVRFLTEEGRPFVIKGHAIAGFQSSQHDDTPWLPLVDPDLGRYPANNSSGDALDLEAKGVWLLTPNIQLGGGFGIRHASNFEDYTGGLFIRYFFEDRKASYSTDIPNSLFGSIQSY